MKFSKNYECVSSFKVYPVLTCKIQCVLLWVTSQKFENSWFKNPIKINDYLCLNCVPNILPNIGVDQTIFKHFSLWLCEIGHMNCIWSCNPRKNSTKCFLYLCCF